MENTDGHEPAMELKGAVAVITGASRGIGRATAIEFARAGADVVVAARSTEGSPSKLPGTIEETAREVQALGRRALAVPCNIADEEQVEALAQCVREEFGRVDILVNNAAANFHSSLSEIPMRRWDLVLNVNLRGTVLCTRALLPQMLEQGSGRIINVSSGAAVNPEGSAGLGMLAYAVSKAGVETFTRGLAAELRPRGIAVNCLRIERGILTEGAEFLRPHFNFADWEKPVVAALPILWLATREISYTGQVVTIAQVERAMARGA